MFAKKKGCLLLTVISIALTMILTKSCNKSRYISIAKTFSPMFKKVENDITYGCNIINLVHDIEYYKNTPIEVGLSSNPYGLYFFVESNKIKDVEIKELSFECDGVVYLCKMYKLSKKISNKKFRFTVEKIALPHIKNKELTINYKMKITFKDGKIIDKEIKAIFISSYKIESGFKFVKMMMSV